jgi:hypothetical protein
MASTGFANGNLTVAADVGNFGVKLAVDNPDGRGKGKIAQMLHALHETDETTYAHLSESYSDLGTHQFIRWNNRFFILGEAAFSAASDIKPLQGRSKYQKSYFGVLFMSGLLQLMRNSGVPERINVFAGYPPGDREQKDNLQKALLGRWSLDSLGKKTTVFVDYAIGYDEIVGGAMNVALASDGTRIVGHPLTTDGPTIAVDIGGGTTDFLRLGRNGMPDYSKISSRRVGINDAVATFKLIFDRKHREHLQDALNGLPIERIYECFFDPKHRVRLMGDEYIDCKDIYNQSVNKILNTIRDAFADFSQGSVNYNYVLLTGGGCGLLERELREQIFPRFDKAKAIFLAEEKTEMFYANVRGARKMIRPMVERAKQREA